mgnify:CR=1 FL=1
MRAIIDIGTNSVRLLMAEKDEKGEWKILRKELRIYYCQTVHS